MDNKAQVHVLEVVLVAGMLLVSLYFVKTFDISPNSVISKENKLVAVGDGILSSLEGVPDPTDEYNNLLARYADGTDIDEFTAYINSSVPDGTQYEINVINVSYMSKTSDATIASSSTTLYNAAFKIGAEAYASKVVVINGLVYKIVLQLYFILR